MADNVSYRELTKEIRNLNQKIDKRFDDLESCLGMKVDVDDFRQLEEVVEINKRFRIYVTGAVGITMAALGLLADRLLSLLFGN